MPKSYNLANLGLSDYAIHTYLSLLQHHPINGSQLSKRSGIPRARIYDVLRTLKQRGFVNEASQGLFVPLPPDELIKQLRRSYEKDLDTLQGLIDDIRAPADHDFIWTITGYQRVMDKAWEMIDASRLGDQKGLHRWVMAEVPSIVCRIPDYAKLGIHGVSIGSNDLTQLMLGVDRDSEICAELFDEADAAVLWAIESIITTCREAGVTLGVVLQHRFRPAA